MHIHDLTDKGEWLCVCVCASNNVYMGKTSLSNDCICTLAMRKTSPPYSIVLDVLLIKRC